jgi:hypothetical protein
VRHPREEGPCRQHHSTGPDSYSELSHNTRYSLTREDKVIHALLEKPEVRLIFDSPSDRLAIKLAVGLGSCSAHSGALAGIERAKLNPGLIGRRSHRTAQRIHFFYQVAFSYTPDRRVTGHLPHRLDIMGKKQRFLAHAGSSQSGLGASVASSYYNYIEFFGKMHSDREKEG